MYTSYNSDLVRLGLKGCENIQSKARLHFELPFALFSTAMISKCNASFGAYSFFRGGRVSSLSRVGRYTSIAPGLSCGDGNHPIRTLSSHQFQYGGRMFDYYSDYKKYKSKDILTDEDIVLTPPEIGNDVWIGANVTVLRGVKIRDGAVVAAGAIVNKNVPPYAIIGGVPAKLIKYRFSDSVIAKLLSARWWDLSFKEIASLELNYRKPEEAASKVLEYRESKKRFSFRAYDNLTLWNGAIYYAQN